MSCGCGVGQSGGGRGFRSFRGCGVLLSGGFAGAGMNDLAQGIREDGMGARRVIQNWIFVRGWALVGVGPARVVNNPLGLMAKPGVARTRRGVGVTPSGTWPNPSSGRVCRPIRRGRRPRTCSPTTRPCTAPTGSSAEIPTTSPASAPRPFRATRRTRQWADTGQTEKLCKTSMSVWLMGLSRFQSIYMVMYGSMLISG